MYDASELLGYIDPCALDYQEWVNVGMALKQEGHTAYEWDMWSQKDTARYKPGECFRKWEGFLGSSSPVTGGTLVEYARRAGFAPERDQGRALSWDDMIVRDDLVVVDKSWLESGDVEEPSDEVWNPVSELLAYLGALFQSTENVGYVTKVYETTDGKLSPQKGNWARTAGQLIEELGRCSGDIGAVLGDYNPEAGAWIRFNPLDGNGVKNENVTDYRYALVESDSVEVGRQNAIIRALELPVAAMVFSGGKSVHAIVKIEAGDLTEYKKRVEYLYKVCEKNGLKVDTQNKNPSRLSRMPGVKRKGRKQWLMGTNLGKSSWAEWLEWIESINDDLPDPEELSGVWDELPPLADCLIKNVLRKGHKMLLAGPSKAGKSFALIELVIAIAEGRKWLGFDCAQGKVLYVNLELDRASCLHRFKDVYQALGWEARFLGNIDIWNLRGKSVPMDKLAPKLIRRAEKKNYIAVVIDPIYKVITGDENSADQMAKFCNQFDLICTQLQAATIYCHHHSKGAQGGKKSMDRASGSGVFARDPDALLDLTELELTEAIKKQEAGKARIRAIERVLEKYCHGWMSDIGQDDRLSPTAMQDYASAHLSFEQVDELYRAIADETARQAAVTAWRIEGTLREFPKFSPINLWFDYPTHRKDETGALGDIKVDDGNPWGKKQGDSAKKKSAAQKSKEMQAELSEAFEAVAEDGKCSIESLADVMGVSQKTVRRRLSKAKDFEVTDSIVILKEQGQGQK